MKLEDPAQLKVMSVQERIRALNKSTNNEPKSSGWAPNKLRSNNLQATRTKSPVLSLEQNITTQLDGEACLAQIRDDELNHRPNRDRSAATECVSSNSGELQLDETEQQAKEEPQSNENSLSQFMLDSYPREGSQLSDESDDGAADNGASVAVKYWRRSKGELESTGTNGIAIEKGTTEVAEEQVSVEDFGEKNTLSTYDKSDEELQPRSVIRSVEIKCESNPVVSPEEFLPNQAQDNQIENGGEIMVPPPPQFNLSTGVSSPPDILRTVHSYPDMDAIEPKNETVHHEIDATKQTEKASDRQEEKSSAPCNTTMEKEKPTTTKSFSQRALEKRSRRRAAQQNLQQIPSPKSNTSEVESATVLSGSTTHSTSTIHTTTLSSRATRLLREKRQGNIAKTDGLAKSLAQNLLRGKTPSPAENKLSYHAKPTTTNEDGEHGKLETQSNLMNECAPAGHDESPKLAENCNIKSEANTQKLSPPVNSIPPPGLSDRRHANTNINLPIGYQMQRQPSHVSPQSNSIQFGRSPSFQNVEVGIATGPTIYPKPYGASPSLNPVAGIPYAPYPSPSPRYTPNRAAPTPNDLLVQLKFSRYNSFDVTNPKPAPIKNVLTEDSASWDDSFQDETQDGTSTQDSFSLRNGPLDGQESYSTGHYSSNRPPSIESAPRLDSFPKGKSFDHGCAVLEQLQNACDHLSPKSCNSTQIIPNSSMNDLIHVESTFSNTEDVAIEVEYVTQSQEPEQEDIAVDDHTIESSSIYSLSTREMEMESKDSYSIQ